MTKVLAGNHKIFLLPVLIHLPYYQRLSVVDIIIYIKFQILHTICDDIIKFFITYCATRIEKRATQRLKNNLMKPEL